MTMASVPLNNYACVSQQPKPAISFSQVFYVQIAGRELAFFAKIDTKKARLLLVGTGLMGTMFLVFHFPRFIIGARIKNNRFLVFIVHCTQPRQPKDVS